MEKKTLAKMFGSRVRAARNSRGWSQAEFAELIGVSTNHVGVIERGETVPSLDTVEACAKAFSVRVGELVDEPLNDAPWIGKLVALAHSVPTHKRRLLVMLVAAVATGITIEDEEDRSPASDLKRSRAAINQLLAHDPLLDDPKVISIVAILRSRTPKQLEQVLQVLKALDG